MLLDKLVAAKDRGVSVRVILDRDRPTDPYRSTVINSPAKEYLEAHGVPVRWDTEEHLLHSKFVLVDGAIAVIGSHNWSVGSYAEYDEVSLALASTSFVATLLSRFDALWEAGDAN
jgi:phosphatidylserine/phosphatidylglycerophosphate/cardiolipin synthase-like enzyme